MAKEKLNVQTIAEVLIEEIAKMETTTKRVETASQRIENAVNKPMSIDTKELKELLSHQEGMMKEQTDLFREKLYTPKWAVKAVVFMVILLSLFTALAVGVSVYYQKKYEKADETAQYWYEQFQELEKTVPKKSR
jgi:hypothetical protein